MSDVERAEIIFKQAVAYAAGAMAIDRVLTPEKTFSCCEPLPFILNSSFAAELFLKALLKCEGKVVRDHKYISLFKKLSPRYQDKIAERYRGACGKPDLSRRELEERIESISNTFSKWRYIYESTGSNLRIRWLTDLSNAVMFTSVSCRPEWKNHLKLIARAKDPRSQKSGR